MSIPDLAQKLDQTESTFGQVHPQVYICQPIIRDAARCSFNESNVRRPLVS